MKKWTNFCDLMRDKPSSPSPKNMPATQTVRLPPRNMVIASSTAALENAATLAILARLSRSNKPAP